MAAQSDHAPHELLGPLNDVEQKNAPQRLFVAGHRELLDAGPRLSIVGSRRPSPEGARRAESLARSSARRGAVVVSGLAEGIDTVVHQTVLREGGKTIAVLGTPLDRFYPPANRELQLRLMREHLVVSQFPPGSPVLRKNFPIRNRTMALISGATVIVEAGEGSGTLHQGWEALRLGRLLFLMESLVQREDLTWPQEMLRYGAQVLSRENLDAMLEALPERHREEPAF